MPGPDEMTSFWPERMLIQWHITDRCNLRCSHCYQDDAASCDPDIDDLVSALDHIKAFFERCRMESQGGRFRAHITVTGGEPFIRDDFQDLLQILSSSSRDFSFAVLTNGTMITPAVARLLRQVKPCFVQVSIDGSRSTHDRIRGEGSYNLAVDGIRLLVREKVPVHISFTAWRGNYREFPDVVRLGRRLGVDRIWSDRMVPCGRGGSLDDGFMCPDETRAFFSLMRMEKARPFVRQRVSMRRSLQFLVSDSNKPYRCSAGDTLITVMPNGDVLPCRRMPVKAGNIFSNDLGRIYDTSDLLIKLRNRDRIAAGCEGCFYARTCSGGSRCLSYAIYGDPFRADPGCWLSSDISNKNAVYAENKEVTWTH